MGQFKKAIVVEDNEPTRRPIDMALEAIGIRDITNAENGVKALDALASTQADIAIVDWQMDVMDGLEFTRKVRDGYGGIDPKTPIVMLTGVRGDDAENKARAAGVDLFMNKPFSVKSLLEGINPSYS